MFSVKAGRTDEGIVIEAEHPYIFDRLKLPATKASIAEMFESYGTVRVAFRGTEEVCEKVKSVDEEASITVPPAKHETSPVSEPEASPQAEAPLQEAQPARHEPSAFDKYRHELTMLGADPKIIFIRHKEKDETESQEDSTLQGDDDE